MAGACAGLIRGDTKAGAIKGSVATRTPLHDLAISVQEMQKKHFKELFKDCSQPDSLTACEASEPRNEKHADGERRNTFIHNTPTCMNESSKQ
jgi:hypothetical protein